MPKRPQRADHLAINLTSRRALAECIEVRAFYLTLRTAILGAPTSAQPEQRRFIFFFCTPERGMQMRQLGRLPVKSERRSLSMGATHREGVRGGSVTLPHFILRHRPIFDVSDFPMLLGFPLS